jgi:TusA-related sulfurtransferase
MIVEVIATKMKLVSDLTNWVEENNRLQIVRDTVSPE